MRRPRNRAPWPQLVREQVALAKRQVDYHLAHARAAAAVRATGLHTPALAPVQALLRTMQRLHAERAICFELAPQAQNLAFKGEEQDLFEMLGNLIDNAGKWARQRVVVDIQPQGSALCITVDDDGPGIAPDQRERMFERGVQLDEQHPGSGLGLNIVQTLAHTYGGQRGSAGFAPWAAHACSCACRAPTEHVTPTGGHVGKLTHNRAVSPAFSLNHRVFPTPAPSAC
jgi:K+-sensing histidine kinase KdpD